MRGADINARVQRGADLDFPRMCPNGLTPFLVAAQSGNIAIMKELIALGADAKAIAPDGTGPVLLAASSRKIEAVRMLVELGFDVNQAPKDRPGPLHAAVRSGVNEIVQYLADHGADLDFKDNFGRTPLEEAEFEAPAPTIELMRKIVAARK